MLVSFICFLELLLCVETPIRGVRAHETSYACPHLGMHGDEVEVWKLTKAPYFTIISNSIDENDRIFTRVELLSSRLFLCLLDALLCESRNTLLLPKLIAQILQYCRILMIKAPLPRSFSQDF